MVTYMHALICTTIIYTIIQTLICSMRGVASSAFFLSPTPCSSRYIASLANFVASSRPAHHIMITIATMSCYNNLQWTRFLLLCVPISHSYAKHPSPQCSHNSNAQTQLTPQNIIHRQQNGMKEGSAPDNTGTL